ncbi:hypothetical protein EVAR_87134_1 [Eumeta japonica]|uniref:Uncharacterized protein n=1 Tax=Eumeta variegata TaxID=151549 RepID=A0A4C1VV13_EUMVA|nr:hypothetical protein EVAR_87134_1 [Eumeta japonica]
MEKREFRISRVCRVSFFISPLLRFEATTSESDVHSDAQNERSQLSHRSMRPCVLHRVQRLVSAVTARALNCAFRAFGAKSGRGRASGPGGRWPLGTAQLMRSTPLSRVF